MYKHNIILVFIIALLIFSCSKKSDPTPLLATEPITLLTFVQKNSMSTASTEDWIYATDEEGTVLDAKPFENDEVITLKTDKAIVIPKINISILTYYSDVKEAVIFSYLGISPGDSWTLGSTLNNTPPVSKNYALTISNHTGSSINLIPSTIVGRIGGSGSGVNTTYTMNFDVRNSDKFYVSTYKLNDPVFYEGTNTQNVNSSTIDFNTDFKPLDNIFNFDYAANTSVSITISGVRKGESNAVSISNVDDPVYSTGYLNSFIIKNETQAGTVKVGFNNGFDFYRTSAQTSSNKVGKSYNKFGTPVKSFSFPNHTGSITGNSFSNFTYSISGTFQMRQSVWANSESTFAWYVYSPPEGKQLLTTIPQEILLKYSVIAHDQLKYLGNTFTIYLDGFTYSDYIGSKMKVSTAKKTSSKEYQTISF